MKNRDIGRKDKAKGLVTLSIYSIKEYDKMKCYIGPNNSSGYAIKNNDELVSVFSTQGSSGAAIVENAIKNGARRLDCFAIRKNDKIEGQLYSLYSKHGFVIDKSLNKGEKHEPYSIHNGISSFVDDNGIIHEKDERVVIFMKLNK